ncbi:hypothetical protein M422DRAFT_776725 [Sphaerobolus stellatus SS14]|nr:hypothetical protein M422DRAFT_776725 [Sphaerobolus stellatus SS14]
MAPKVTLFAMGNIAPNPPKIAIFLEELGVEYAIVHKVELNDGPNGVRAAEHLKINPNARVPALIDHTNNDFTVWESAAILLYVGERFDPEQKYIGKTLEERTEIWQWLSFEISGLGPMQGQNFYFKHFHPVKDLDESVYERYRNETYRIYGVLEKQLEKHDWIALDKFTVVDIAIHPWMNIAHLAGLDVGRFPKLEAYTAKVKARPSVVRAFAKLAPKERVE